ncbi:hypothetical protein BN903_3 [Halorubrum sp. AJ67]|nr:hypothetical protein BN903_3 [Halorubrum sp. AJ67]
MRGLDVELVVRVEQRPVHRLLRAEVLHDRHHLFVEFEQLVFVHALGYGL